MVDVCFHTPLGESFMWIVACIYQIEKDGAWHPGIAIGLEAGTLDIKTIIRSNGSALEYAPWDYRVREYQLSVNLNMHFK
jgi:hypothetical protein